MEARAAVDGRRVRAIALTLAVLCMLGLLAPATAHAATARHHRQHVVTAISAISADLHGGSTRLDQPQAVATDAHVRSSARIAGRPASQSPIVSPSAVDSARTRGPPGSAR